MTLAAALTCLRSRPGRCAGIAAGLLLAAAPLCAQPAPVAAPPVTIGAAEDQIAKAAADMAAWPQLQGLSAEQRRNAVTFVFGNMLYAVFHEMGHAVVTEMQLPVLGREEDAADAFAIVAGTRMMTDISERALIEAGKGWFFNDLSDRKNGFMTEFYDSHGMNLQRAYQIVCFLFGANPEKFKPLADATKLPESRQKTCKEDYALAVWSWETALAPHRRKPDQPPTRIDVVYREAKGDLDRYAGTFRKLQFLERIAAMASNAFVWRAPFTMEMETCGHVNAWWSVKSRKVSVCYELVESYLRLYLDSTSDPQIQKRMLSLKPPTPAPVAAR